MGGTDSPEIQPGGTEPPKEHWWSRPARPARPSRHAMPEGTARASGTTSAVVTAIPVILVNATAFIGQFMFVHTHLAWIVPGQVMFALTLETIAVLLAYHAHVAQMADDTSIRLRLGAVTCAAVIGAMNYSHYAAPHWRPTFAAVGLFLMSSISPWLWGIHSRRASRDKLRAMKLIEPHAVRLGTARWFWHPWRSLRVMSWSTWHGVNDPQVAVAHYAPVYGTVDTPHQPRPPRQPRTGPARQEPEIIPARELTRELPRSEPVPPLPPVMPERVPSLPRAMPERAAEPAAASVPDFQDAEVVPGTVLNGVPVHAAEARLTAVPSVTHNGGRPSDEVIARAEKTLRETPFAILPSIREIARDLLGNSNSRTTAARLLKERKAAEQAPVAPVSLLGPRLPAGLLAPVTGGASGG